MGVVVVVRLNGLRAVEGERLLALSVLFWPLSRGWTIEVEVLLLEGFVEVLVSDN